MINVTAIFSSNVKRIRQEKTLSQEQLAEKCETSKNYISQIESEQRFASGIDQCRKQGWRGGFRPRARRAWIRDRVEWRTGGSHRSGRRPRDARIERDGLPRDPRRTGQDAPSDGARRNSR